MDQRLNVITLGVADVARARAFYEQLGWQVAFTDGDIVMFQAGPMIVSLWSAEKLADDSGIDAAPDGWGGFTLGYAVGGAEEVDALCAEAAEAGATITRAPVEKPFGAQREDVRGDDEHRGADRRHVTITLNDDVPDARVRELVEDSYALVMPVKA